MRKKISDISTGTEITRSDILTAVRYKDTYLDKIDERLRYFASNMDRWTDIMIQNKALRSGSMTEGTRSRGYDGQDPVSRLAIEAVSYGQSARSRVEKEIEELRTKKQKFIAVMLAYEALPSERDKLFLCADAEGAANIDLYAIAHSVDVGSLPPGIGRQKVIDCVKNRRWRVMRSLRDNLEEMKHYMPRE